MPELPEVEHIARGLSALLPGRTVRDASVTWERTVATHSAEGFIQTITGRTFGPVSRRGKFLVLDLPPQTVLIHLRMTGGIHLCSGPRDDWEDDAHVHVKLTVDDGGKLYYRDTRKFGRWYLVDDPMEIVGDLGPEPLSADFAAGDLSDILLDHRRQIKPLLLDQKMIAGLGNIYVDEILWTAQIHPVRRSHTLSRSQIERLHRAIRSVLLAAIERGGTTVRDYRDACDQMGAYQHVLCVYGREQEPCPRCGAPIAKLQVAQRGTHICQVCQPEPREEALHDSI